MMSLPIQQIRSSLEELSAVQAADLFLSPHVDGELLRQATIEPGPSLWIVNRSDVYDATLEAMSTHPVVDMASRAKEKLSARKSPLHFLQAPEVDVPWNEVPEYGIEDVLGHPLVNLEAILYFSQHPSEDVRGSSALSLTRRLLEHPPNFSQHPDLLRSLQESFSQMLLTDVSPFARGYAARVPVLDSSVVAEALRREHHPFVKARILQNPSLGVASLNSFGDQDWAEEEAFVARIFALDQRVEIGLRKSVAERVEDCAAAIHFWYGARND
jgi:hypothetical protein